MARILIVEDEKRIQSIVKDYLQKEGFAVATADDGPEALTIFGIQEVDLVILDVMMPYLNGFEVCQLLRQKSNVPILFLTARQEEQDKLLGYDYGADDYLTKPFSPRLLVAKVKALLRRTLTAAEAEQHLTAGHIRLNPTTREVFAADEEVTLTHKEYELLRLFLTHPRQVFSREQLLSRIWGFDFAGSTRTVDVHIKTLRQKLGQEGRQIVTLIRSGYKLEPAKEVRKDD